MRLSEIDDSMDDIEDGVLVSDIEDKTIQPDLFVKHSRVIGTMGKFVVSEFLTKGAKWKKDKIFILQDAAKFVGYVLFKPVIDSPLNPAAKVGLVRIIPAYSGSGLAAMLYKFLLEKKYKAIFSDQNQTKSGSGIWSQLYRTSGLEVYGIIEAEGYDGEYENWTRITTRSQFFDMYDTDTSEMFVTLPGNML
jgi:hypothetical protein